MAGRTIIKSGRHEGEKYFSSFTFLKKVIMKKIISLIALGFFLLISTFIHSQTAESNWPAKPVTIDGKPAEWPEFFRFYLTVIKYEVCNDCTNLYICIKSISADDQSRLIRGGLHIWLDITGRKKEKTGLGFPVKMDYLPEDTGQFREAVRTVQNSIKITGMTEGPEETVPLQNKYGIEAAYSWDSHNILYVEYKIPLALLYHHPVSSADLQHPIALGLTIGPVPSQGEVQYEQKSELATKTKSLPMKITDPNDMAQEVWLKFNLAKGPGGR
jgi:hypothetical protein